MWLQCVELGRSTSGGVLVGIHKECGLQPHPRQDLFYLMLLKHQPLTYWPLGDVRVITKVSFWDSFFKIWIWHDDVIKWKHFPRNWPFVRGIHRSLMNSHKRLSKQSWGWWLETLSCPLWRHCNDILSNSNETALRIMPQNPHQYIGRSPRRDFADHAFMLRCTFPLPFWPSRGSVAHHREGGTRWRYLM